MKRRVINLNMQYLRISRRKTTVLRNRIKFWIYDFQWEHIPIGESLKIRLRFPGASHV